MGNENIWAAVVDIESTGLDANEDVPLEIGVALIDKSGYQVADMSLVVYEPPGDRRGGAFVHAVARGQKHPIVGPMHEKSGLWDDLEKGGRTRYEVDDTLVDWLDRHDVKPGTVPMLGNSIGSLDRPFSIIHFPKFNAFLSYRNIDISTLKELCKAHNPTLFKNLEPIIGTKADATHRVMGDIDACITEYRAYLDNFLFLEEGF